MPVSSRQLVDQQKRREEREDKRKQAEKVANALERFVRSVFYQEKYGYDRNFEEMEELKDEINSNKKVLIEAIVNSI